MRRPGTEEDLLSGQAFFVQATLAEYNGNSHGPETLACQVRPQEPHRYSCLRVAEPKKASEGPLPSASSGGQDQQMQMQGMHHGTAGSGHEHPMHQGEHMQGMHGMHGTKGMHGSGMRGSTSMRGTAAPTASMMGAQQAPMAALPLSLGAVCTPGFGNCPAGSECKAGAAARPCLLVKSGQHWQQTSGYLLVLGFEWGLSGVCVNHESGSLQSAGSRTQLVSGGF